MLSSALGGNPAAIAGTTAGLAVPGLAIASAFGLPQKIGDALANIAGYTKKKNGQEEQPHGGNVNSSNPENYNHGDTIPQSMQEIKPDQAGNFTVADPFVIKGSDGGSLVAIKRQFRF